MDTEAIIAHFHANMAIYIISAVCALPVIFFTRRYSYSLIRWVIEWCVWCTLFHGILWCLVRLARWFRNESQMAWRDDQRTDAGWTTPIIEFWNREFYTPQWLFYVELTAAILILVAIIRYRPMKAQKSRPRTQRYTKGQIPESMRNPYSRGNSGKRDY